MPFQRKSDEIQVIHSDDLVPGFNIQMSGQNFDVKGLWNQDNKNTYSVKVGRNTAEKEENKLALSGNPESINGVSRSHFEITAVKTDRVSTQYCIADLGSKYGTYVNGKRLTPPNAQFIISKGDVVSFGYPKRMDFVLVKVDGSIGFIEDEVTAYPEKDLIEVQILDGQILPSIGIYNAGSIDRSIKWARNPNTDEPEIVVGRFDGRPQITPNKLNLVDQNGKFLDKDSGFSRNQFRIIYRFDGEKYNYVVENLSDVFPTYIGTMPLQQFSSLELGNGNVISIGGGSYKINYRVKIENGSLTLDQISQ